MKRTFWTFSIVCCLAFLFLAGPGSSPPLVAQDIEVTSAVPPSAEQGTINLNVAIKGNGFDRSARAQFFLTDTENPGGITVNSTKFVSRTELIANIDVAEDAVIDKKFDIVVMASRGRTGKGTELFSVTLKTTGQPTCEVFPLPDGFTPVTVLNSDPPSFTGEFGRGIAISRVELNPDTPSDALVAAVTSRISRKVEVFLLDPTSGELLSHIPSLVIPNASADQNFMTIVQGDVNADSIPDIVVASRFVQAAYVFLGKVSGGALSYSGGIPILPPPGQSAGYFGEALAVGDIDGDTENEVLVGAPGADVGSAKRGGKVFVFKFDAGPPHSFTFDRIIAAPSPRNGDEFGRSVAVADVTGDGVPDVAVGAIGRRVSKARNAGAVLVFPGPILADPASVIELSSGVKGQNLGYRTTLNDVSGDGLGDVITVAYLKSPAIVFNGDVSSVEGPSFTLTQSSTGTEGYGTNISSNDINEDGLADVLVAAPNACTGVAYVYLSGPSGPLSDRYVLYPPDANGDALMYGRAVAAAPGSRIFLVGEPRREVGGIGMAGQVYVYSVD
ncbi:MAG TPA: hypothetical protein VM182_16170 [Terriglobia bacterium]|nr:hypothetical protein [Terriglobia bacterium]